MYTYTGGLTGSPGVPHYVGSSGGPTYLPTHPDPSPVQHQQMVPSPLLTNVTSVGPQSCSTSNSGSVGLSLSHSKRKRYDAVILTKGQMA